MSPTPAWVEEVERLALGKPVLLVEGERDAAFFRHFLGQHEPRWDLRLYLHAAGGKRRVIQGVAIHRPGWIGVIDLDEWNPADVQRGADRSLRLCRLPRFCIESYFCHPEELWAALPSGQQERVGNDSRVLAAPILDALPEWVAHGAMWRVLRQLYHAARLPEALEDGPITDEGKVRRILEEWHAGLAPDPVLRQYRQELEPARGLSPDEQLTRYVHGKKFWLMWVQG